MLLNFRVSNFRSFRDEVSLSLVSTRLDRGAGRPVPVARDGSTIEVLPVAAILGANASGKSNLLRAMARMRDLVLTSATLAPYESPEADCFKLDPACGEQPQMMAIDFVLDGQRYEYGFELQNGKFTEEWLHTFPHKRVQILFDRERGDEFTFGKNLRGQNRLISEVTRPAVLFLSAAAQAGHPVLSRVYEYFLENLVLLDVPERAMASATMIARLRERRPRAVKLLSVADLGILDAHVERDELSDRDRDQYRRLIRNSLKQSEFPPEEIDDRVEELLEKLSLDRAQEVVTLVHKARRGGASLPFEEESLGTKSWLSFVAYALEMLENGGVLLVDELDASLHPILVAEAIKMFQEPRLNPRGAQLIFTTHDVTLLGNSFERIELSRGQIWLTEKTDAGASSLTPLSDFRPRKGEDLGRGYLQGRYGGTPRVIAGSASQSLLAGVERG